MRKGFFMDAPLLLIRDAMQKWIKEGARSECNVDEDGYEKTDPYASWKEIGVLDNNDNNRKSNGYSIFVEHLITHENHLSILLGNYAFSYPECKQALIALERRLCTHSKKTSLRLSELDWTSSSSRNSIRQKFNSAWFCPLVSEDNTGDEVLRPLTEAALELTEDRWKRSFLAADLRRVIGEARFYRDLKQKGNEADYLRKKGETKQTWPLYCYNKLVPLWIAQSATLPSVANNLYSIGFWKSNAVRELADALSKCYTECLGITKVQAGRFCEAVHEAQRVYQKGAPDWEEAGYQDQADFENLTGGQNPNPEQRAFRELYENVRGPIEGCFENKHLILPEWVLAKAKLIALIMAPAFLGSSAISAIAGNAKGTKAQFGEGDRNAQSRELGLGSGLVPLQRIDSAEATIAELNLSTSGVSDGLVAVIGRSAFSDHWPNWREETKKAIEDVFAEKMPKTLSKSLYPKLEPMINNALRAGCNVSEEVVNGLRSIIDESIRSHIYAVAPAIQPGGATRPGSVLVKGVRKGRGEGNETLSDVLKNAAAECCEVLDGVYAAKNARTFDGKPVKQSREAVETAFLDALNSFFQDQSCKDGDASRSLVISGVNEVSKQYAEQNPADPSYGYLLINLESKLIGRDTDDKGGLMSMSKKLSFEPLCKTVDAVFDDYLEHEASIRINLIDGNVSRRHAALFLDDGRLYACDLGSTLGTAISDSSGVPADVILVDGSGKELKPLKAASWTKDECKEMRSAPLKRGNVLHIGDAAIKVG